MRLLRALRDILSRSKQRSNRSHLFVIAATLILLFYQATCSAAYVARYQFDIVIFSHITPKTLASETWPALPDNILQQNKGQILIVPNDNQTARPNGAPSTFVNDQIIISPGNQSSIKTVSPRQYLLKKTILKRLATAGNHIILHTSWIQNTRTLKKGTTIHLMGGQTYPLPNHLMSNRTNDNTGLNSNTAPANPSLQKLYQVNGQIKLKLSRYFNFNFNFIFTEPTASLRKILSSWNDNNQWGAWSFFRLMQKRRMRSRELNYIDHPLYGILITIKPLTR